MSLDVLLTISTAVLAALTAVLSVINGLILVYQFLSDRPKLVLSSIHPELYQWWFRLPDGIHEGQITKRFGLLLYIGVANKGKRITTLTSWRAQISTVRRTPHQLKPLTIPEPILVLDGIGKKVMQVFGVRGQYFSGDTIVRPGESTSGFVYYIYEYWGDEQFAPKIMHNTINVIFRVQDIFGKKKKMKVQTNEKALSEIEKMIPGMTTIK